MTVAIEELPIAYLALYQEIWMHNETLPDSTKVAVPTLLRGVSVCKELATIWSLLVILEWLKGSNFYSPAIISFEEFYGTSRQLAERLAADGWLPYDGVFHNAAGTADSSLLDSLAAIIDGFFANKTKQIDGPAKREKILLLSRQRFLLASPVFQVSEIHRTLEVHRNWVEYFGLNFDDVWSWSFDIALDLATSTQVVSNELAAPGGIETARTPTITEEKKVLPVNTLNTEESKTALYSINDSGPSSSITVAVEPSLSSDYSVASADQLDPVETEGRLPGHSIETDREHSATVSSDRSLGDGAASATRDSGPLPNPAIAVNTSRSDTGRDLFSELSLDDPPQALVAIFKRICQRLESLRGPRSLCELRLTKSDYDFLCKVAEFLPDHLVYDWLYRNPNFTDSDLSNHTRREALGTILLLICAEVTRRESKEGTAWPAIMAKFLGKTRTALFFRDQPGGWLKESIESAARALDLRHVFDGVCIQYYYLSIFLQFGFTNRGVGNLPYWIQAQHCPEAISYLLNETLPTYAPSFALVWKKMEAFRKNQCSETEFRELLKDSPWLLPDAVEAFIKGSKLRLPSGAISSTDDTTSVARLRWQQPADPYFEVPLDDLNVFGNQSKALVIECSNGKTVIVPRSADGWFPSQTVHSNIDQSAVELTILDEKRTRLASTTIPLWSDEEEIEVFDFKTGLRLEDANTETMDPTRAYLLLVTSDIEPIPPLSQCRQLPSCDKVLWLLQPGWGSEFAVYLNGQEFFWRPIINFKKKRDIPFAIEQLKVKLGALETSGKDSSQYPFHVAATTKKVRLMRLAIGGTKVEFAPDRNGIGYTSKPVDISSAYSLKGISAKLRVEYEGQIHAITRHVPYDHFTVLNWERDHWTKHDPAGLLVVDEAQRSYYHFAFPSNEPVNIAETSLFEGGCLYGPTSSRRQRLDSLSGYGAALQIKETFGRESQKTWTVSNEVVDPGCLRSVERVNNLFLELRLRTPIYLTTEHSIQLWSDDGTFETVSSEKITALGPTLWQIVMSAADELAVTISYDGGRLGSWWSAEPASFLSKIRRNMMPEDIGALIRWMHFPILSQAAIREAQRYFVEHPVWALRSWLTDFGLPDELRHREHSRAWRGAIRDLVGWNFPILKNESLRILASVIENDDSSELTVGLFAVNPLLAYAFISQLMDFGQCSNNALGTGLLEVLRQQASDFKGAFTEPSEQGPVHPLLKDAAQKLKLDEIVLRDICSRINAAANNGDLLAVSQFDRQTFSTALAVESFKTHQTCLLTRQLLPRLLKR